MKENKPWITDEERQDVADRVKEFEDWFEDIVSKDAELKPHEDPTINIEEIQKKMKKVLQLYKKVNGKAKPKPPKEEKVDEEEEEKKDEKKDEETNDGNE